MLFLTKKQKKFCKKFDQILLTVTLNNIIKQNNIAIRYIVSPHLNSNPKQMCSRKYFYFASNRVLKVVSKLALFLLNLLTRKFVYFLAT